VGVFPEPRIIDVYLELAFHISIHFIIYSIKCIDFILYEYIIVLINRLYFINTLYRILSSQYYNIIKEVAMKKLLILSISIILCLIMTGCEPEKIYVNQTVLSTVTSPTTTTVTSTSVSTTTVTQQHTVTLTPTTETTSFSPVTFTGSSDSNTALFTAPDSFLIEWSYSPQPGMEDIASFGYFLYPAGETVMYVDSMVFPSSASGSSYCYAGAGQYYFEVICNAVTNWTITVSPA
jgi:hypothetical protein